MIGDDTEIRNVCDHEAGHCVMRWIRCREVTDTFANSDGTGMSYGCSARAEENLLILLAGIAVESYYGVVKVDFDSSKNSDAPNEDVNMAVSILESKEGLRNAEPSGASLMPMEEALQHWFKRTCDELYPYRELVDMVADVLEANAGRIVSASELQPIFDDWETWDKEEQQQSMGEG